MKYLVRTELGWAHFDLPDWFEHKDIINVGDKLNSHIIYDPWWNRLLRNIFGEDSFPKKMKEHKNGL